MEYLIYRGVIAIGNYQAVINYEQKNRAFIRIFWICVLAVSFLEVLNFALYHTIGYSRVFENYFMSHIVLPVALNCALGLLLTILDRRCGNRKSVQMSYALMLGFVLLADIVVLIHYHVSVIFLLFMFPVFLTLVYNNIKLTYITSAASMGSYLLIVLFYLPSRAPETFQHDYMDVTAVVASIIIALLVGMQVLNASSDLINMIIDETIKKVTMERASKEDSLTKLYNHAVFYDYLDLAILNFKSTRTPFTIVVMDIDNFKKVNDTYGHAFGDQVLLKLVETIQNNVSPDDVPFRYGGEEFALMAFSPIDKALDLAERIREDFSQAVVDPSVDAKFTLSGGLSMFGEQYIGKREFFASADRALYIAKRSGKNKCVVATDQDMDTIMGGKIN